MGQLTWRSLREEVCEEAAMNGPVTETQWYIAREGKQHGPLTDIEMRTFVAHSYLRVTDLIWRPGMAEWLPAPQVFPAVFQSAAAPHRRRRRPRKRLQLAVALQLVNRRPTHLISIPPTPKTSSRRAARCASW